MSNPFKTKDHANIPLNLDACCYTDYTAGELWRIANAVDTWGGIIFVLLLILGIILSFCAATAVNDIVDGAGSPLFLYTALTWGVIAVVECIGYHLISISVRAFASIVQNTRVSANVALYAAANSTPMAEHSSTTPVAPNFNNTPTEENIHIQPASHTAESPNQTPVFPVVVSPEEIICPNCGTRQRRNRKCCFNCNLLFIKEDL